MNIPTRNLKHRVVALAVGIGVAVTGAIVATGPVPAAQAAGDCGWRSVYMTPDWNGDGKADVIGVQQNGDMYLYAGTGSGSLRAGVKIGTGWNGLDVYLPGDWNGDKKNDLIAVGQADGKMWLYPGNGKGGFSAKKLIGIGWKGLKVIPVGDINGDKTTDLVTVNARGEMNAYYGTGKGGFKYPYPKIGWGWGGYNIIPPGDLTGNGKNDLLGVTPRGDLMLYKGDGKGRFFNGPRVGYGWSTYTLAGGADLTGDGRMDIIGRNEVDGKLWLYRGMGNGGFSGKTQIGTGWKTHASCASAPAPKPPAPTKPPTTPAGPQPWPSPLWINPWPANYPKPVVNDWNSSKHCVSPATHLGCADIDKVKAALQPYLWDPNTVCGELYGISFDGGDDWGVSEAKSKWQSNSSRLATSYPNLVIKVEVLQGDVLTDSNGFTIWPKTTDNDPYFVSLDFRGCTP